jgi:hypothetical protein
MPDPVRPITGLLPISGWPIRQSVPFDGPQVDAFGRSRISSIETLFDGSFQYDKQPNLWIEDTAGAGSATHAPAESAVSLQVGTASGDRATMTSRRYNRYQPGKSQQIVYSGVIGASKSGVNQRIGYFDGENGVFFQQTGSGMQVVIRSKTSGSVVNTVIKQADWNLDKMDKSGPSGIELDFTKLQIFIIDFQWLGSGRVRFGFGIRGGVVYCHQELHANLFDTVYMTTAHLPLRFEIENVSTSASPTTMKQVCVAVSSEGGFDTTAITFGRSRLAAAGLSYPNAQAVLSIRPRALFNGITNRSLIVPTQFVVHAQDNPCLVEIKLGGTLGGTPVWNPVQADSSVEYSETIAAVTGGRVIAAGFADGNRAANSDILAGTTDPGTNFANALNVADSVQEQLSIICTPLVSTSDARASLVWREFH